MAQIRGCHLIGSVPLPNTETVFRQCSASLPGRLKRIPDGETGHRQWFTLWQAMPFQQASPELCVKFEMNRPVPSGEFTPEQIDEYTKKLEAAGPLQTGYDHAAIESYAVFKKLRDEGVIAKGTRFQVSLPTPCNTLGPFVEGAFHSRVEPIYEEALYRAMRNVQNTIPHEELAIQIDLAIETGYWERFPWFKPWFGDGSLESVKSYIVDYIVRMIGQVDADVEVGLHNCYGDMEHHHFMEPASLAAIVERGLRVYEKTPHKINFFHVPVPVSAIDKLDTYLEPIKELLPKFKEHNTDLILGLIHYNEREKTHKMIDAAKRVLGDFPFTVATECGMGRTPPDQLEEILKLSAEVSEPVL